MDCNFMFSKMWDKFMLFMDNQHPGQKFTPGQYAEFYDIFKAGYDWAVRDKEKSPIDSDEEQTEPRFLDPKKLRAGYD